MTVSAASLYDDKPLTYFGNVRRDIVGLLPTDRSSAVLELGCGSGGTGEAVLAAGRAGRYVGIELSEQAAQEARQRLSEVYVGDVQTLDFSVLRGQFDAVIASEVLEHLSDPWSVVGSLVDCLKPGGHIYASSPNVSHWTVLRELLRGKFEYQDAGFMDRTHLRWFTPSTYREMFLRQGIEVLSVGPLVPLRPKARMFDRLTGGRYNHLFVGQIMLIGRKSPA